MTPIVLLERLKEFIQENTKDIILSVRPVKLKTIPEPEAKGKKSPAGGDKEITHRAAEVHLMRLPDKEAETQRIPYIVLQCLTGRDEHKPEEDEDSTTSIRIIVVTYSDNDSEGALDVLNVITRIRVALMKAGVIGEQFFLRKPLEFYIYPDDTQPYFMGEMMTVWEMPTLRREVHTHYVES